MHVIVCNEFVCVLCPPPPPQYLLTHGRVSVDEVPLFHALFLNGDPAHMKKTRAWVLEYTFRALQVKGGDVCVLLRVCSSLLVVGLTSIATVCVHVCLCPLVRCSLLGVGLIVFELFLSACARLFLLFS